MIPPLHKKAVDLSLLEHVPHALAAGFALHASQNAALRASLQGKLGVSALGRAAEELAQKRIPGIGGMGDLSKSPVLRAASRLKGAKNANLGESLATNFYRGLHDIHPSPVSQHIQAFASGLTAPEPHLMHQEARIFGGRVRALLHEKGLSPAHLSDSEQQVAHHVLAGNYLQAHDLLHQGAAASGTREVGLAAAKALETSTGMPIHALLSNPGASRMHLYRMQRAARNPRNWLTANILPEMSKFRPPESLSGIPGSQGGRTVDTTFSGVAGSAVLGIAEPAGGILNAAKHLAAAPGTARFGERVKQLAGNQVLKGRRQADEGIVYGRVRRAISEVAGSPVLSGLRGQLNEMASVTNNMTAHLASSKVPYAPAFSPSLHVNKAREVAGSVQTAAASALEKAKAAKEHVSGKVESLQRYTSAKADNLHSILVGGRTPQ
jgi:hypothetical protein